MLNTHLFHCALLVLLKPIATITLLVISLILSPLANAATQKEPTLSNRVSVQLNKINELLGKEAYEKALQKLNAMQRSLKPNTFESAMVYQTLGYLYVMQNNQYESAITYFERSLPGLAASHFQSQKTRKDLGQLYLTQAKYRQAITVLEAWREHTEKDLAQVNVFLAMAYAQLEDAKPAIGYMEQAFALAAQPMVSTQPTEQWYQLLLTLYLQEDQFTPASDLLHTMIALYPEAADYWKRLGAIQLQLKQFTAAAASLEIAWQRGALHTEDGITRLAKLLLRNKNPYKAAMILETALSQEHVESTMENWRLLGDALLLAREENKAITALAKAAELSTDGNQHVRVAELYIHQQRWQQANAELGKALEKPQVKDLKKCICYEASH